MPRVPKPVLMNAIFHNNNSYSQGKRSFNPIEAGEVDVWLDGMDFDTFTLDTGEVADGWENKSPTNSINAVANGVARPLYKENAQNGKPGLYFDGVNNYMTMGTKPDWVYLHDGTPFSTYIVYSIEDADTELLSGLLSTSQGGRGIYIGADDRTSWGINEGHTYRVLSDAGVNTILSLSSNTLEHQQINIFSSLFGVESGVDNDLFVYAHNQEIGSGDITGVFSSGEPADVLNLGSLAFGQGKLKGTLHEVLIYKDKLNSENHENVLSYLQDKWYEYLQTNDGEPLQSNGGELLKG